MSHEKKDTSTKKKYGTNKYIKINLILCLFIAFFNMLGKYSYVSILLSLTFVVLLLNVISLFKRVELDRKTVINLFLLIFIMVLSLTVILGVSNGITFDYIKKYIMFCSTLILLFIVTKVVVDQKMVNFVFLINFLFFFIYCFFYFFGNRAYYGDGITLNFTNPNLLSLWLMHTFMFLLLFMIHYKPFLLKIVGGSAATLILIIIFETKTRSIFFSLAFVFIMLFIFIIHKNFKFGKIINGVIISYPLIFSIVYMKAVYSPFIREKFSFLISEGKPLDSRFNSWNSSFYTIKNNFLSGNYYEVSGGTGKSQLLNTHIDVLASYGVIVLILFLIYLYRITLEASKTSTSALQKIALTSFFAVIISGTSEAALVSGSVGMYILSCTFLLIVRFEKNNSNY